MAAGTSQGVDRFEVVTLYIRHSVDTGSESYVVPFFNLVDYLICTLAPHEGATSQPALQLLVSNVGEKTLAYAYLYLLLERNPLNSPIDRAAWRRLWFGLSFHEEEIAGVLTLIMEDVSRK